LQISGTIDKEKGIARGRVIVEAVAVREETWVVSEI
jgi:hypothetical protein